MEYSRREFLGLAALFGLEGNSWFRSYLKQNDPKNGPSEIDNKNPYLKTVYAPITSENTFENLPVIGDIPEEINGSYYRNGPNPQFTTDPHHWFDGDGMIHRISIREGKASYCNRYVRTTAWSLENSWNSKIFPGLYESFKARHLPQLMANALFLHSFSKDTSNTDLIYFQDKIISLWWLSGAPYQLDPETLETRGVAQFEGYNGNVAAHARIDPQTGELFFLDFSKVRGWVRVVKVSKEGKMVWVRKFKTPSGTPRIYHDILFTKNYVILMDFPVGIQIQKGCPMIELGFDERSVSRIVLIPREDPTKVRKFYFDPCYVLHGVNAFEVDHQVVLSVCKFVGDPFRKRTSEDDDRIPYVGPLRVETCSVLWTLDLATQEISEQVIDDTSTEFPRINDEYLGQKSRYSYNPKIDPANTLRFDGVIKYDWDKGTKQILQFPPNHLGEEVVFIPRQTRKSEDDGWIATVVHNLEDNTQSFCIYDAQTMDYSPVAQIVIPGSVPHGFHAKWIPHSGRS